MPTQEDSEGNELCQAFLANDATTLYVAVTGNTNRTDTDQNTILVFIDTDTGATPMELDTDGFTGGSLALLNLTEVASGTGATLDFDPEWAIAVWNDVGTNSAYLHDLTNAMDAGALLTEYTDYAVDNANLLGVSDRSGDDPDYQAQLAVTATTGLELAIPLGDLGITDSSEINVQVLLVSGSGYISNQSLPPLSSTGGEPNIGYHIPSDPEFPNIVNFATDFPTNQYVSFALTPAATPSITLDGDITGVGNTDDWGTAVSVQNNYTDFGDARAFNPGVTGGNELDQIWMLNDFAKLYVGVTGQISLDEGNRNVLIVFLQTPTSGSLDYLLTAGVPNNLGPGVLQPLDGFAFDTGFRPNWAIQMWREGGQTRAILQNLDIDGAETELAFTNDPAQHTGDGYNVFTADLNNTDGVNDIPGDDPLNQEAFAMTAVKGVQFSIDLSDIGQGSNQNISAMAMIASVSDGGANSYVSNQFLPVLRPSDPTPVCSVDTDNPEPDLALTDEDVTTRSVALTNAAALLRVTGIQVTLDITHPAVEELNIDLVHEATGRTVRLWDTTSGSGANMNTTFVQDGTALADCPDPGTTFTAPFESLLTFNDVDPIDGNWALNIEDTVAGNTGTLNSWTIGLREDIGGGVACLGTHNTDSQEGEVNIIDLSTYDGDQNFTHTLDAFSGAPTTWNGDEIPTAFGDPEADDAIVTQNNYTCFGNALLPSFEDPNDGSELDQLFVKNTTERLRLAVTGNLQTNGNAFVLLFDTDPGDGENVLVDNPTPPRPIGGDGGSDPGINGMVLDTNFWPDYALSVHEFFGGYRVDLVNLNDDTNRWLGIQGFNSESGELAAPAPVGGSELDQLFVQNDATNLYIGFTGNLEGNNNGFVIFLDTKAGGSNVLATLAGQASGWPTHLAGDGGSQNGMDGDTLAAGFGPDYALVLARSGSYFLDGQLVDLSNTGLAPTTIPWSETIGSNVFVGNNDNELGVDGDNTNCANEVALAATATTGLQFSLDRTLIEAPANGNNISISVILMNDGGYWSNQALPGFSCPTDNLSAGDPPIDPVDADAVGHSVATYVMSATYAAPTTWDGADIPTAMGGTALTTQTNYTGFGDQAVDPDYDGNANCAQIAFDNTNLLGVTGCEHSGLPCACLGGEVSLAGSVDTGMEIDLALADLGLTATDVENELGIKVMAVLVSNTGYVSNQILPSETPASGELCDLSNGVWPSGVDLTTVAGDQFLPYTLQVPCGSDPADINGDGDVDDADISAFVSVLLGTNFGECDLMKSEYNVDGDRNGLDVQGFVEALLGL